MNRMFVRFLLGITIVASVRWVARYVDYMTTPEQATQHLHDNGWNERAIDTAIALLKDGYVVLRMGNSTQSRMLANINKQDQRFSHCGVVLIEDNYPYVYHSIGGEDNPDARLRRDSASHFFSAASNSALGIVKYDFMTATVDTLREIVHAMYQLQPRFDTHFDLNSTDKLYCTEFVRCVLTTATADTGYIPLSEAMGRQYVGTDNLYLNKHAAFVWQVKFK